MKTPWLNGMRMTVQGRQETLNLRLQTKKFCSEPVSGPFRVRGGFGRAAFVATTGSQGQRAIDQRVFSARKQELVSG